MTSANRKGKDPTTWRPWTGENWNIHGMLNTWGGTISRSTSLDKYYYGQAWILFVYLCSTYV